MIVYRNGSADTNASGQTATQIRVARPTGVIDGDFLVASVCAADGSSSAIIAPAGWTLVRRIDASTTISLAIYYKFAQGELSGGWTWSFTNPQTHTAVVRAYTGVDVFAPIDSDQGQTSTASTTPAIPSLTTSLATVVLESCASVGNVTVTPPTGYTKRVISNQTGVSLEVSDTILTVAGVTATATDTLGSSNVAITHVMALRPAVGVTATVEQVRQAFKNAFPPGAEDLYDWDNTDTDINKLTVSIATWMKYYGYDYVDLLRQEFQPLTAVVKLVDWEAAFGISRSSASAANSWIATRQQAVLAKLRESGGSTVDNIRLAVEPELGYAGSNIGTAQVFETNRIALTRAHTYSNTTGATITAGTSPLIPQTVLVPDDGKVSAAGIVLTIVCASDIDPTCVFKLTGPGAAGAATTCVVSFSPKVTTTNGSNTIVFMEKAISAGCTINGNWNLKITAGVNQLNLTSWSLFVEGIGIVTVGGVDYNAGLGWAIFDWGVYADPSKNVGADFQGARNAIKRITPGHARGHLLRTLNPIPGASQVTYPGTFFPTTAPKVLWPHVWSYTPPRPQSLPTACYAQSITSKLPLP